MAHRRPVLPVAAGVAALILASGTAHAQSPSLSSILGSSFGISVDEDLADEMNRSIAEQVATYPVATSSGGFTYEFDPALGIARRNTRSFGPLFIERAMTIGARNVSAGVNVQHAKFDRYGDKHLTRFRFAENQDPDDQFFSTMELDIDTDTTALVAEVGLLPKLDVGVVVPFVSVRMNARLSSGETAAAPTRLTSAAGSSSGLGDIVVKGKYQFYQRPGGGWAAAADLRLPTGDFFNLRGAPFALLKLYAVGSMETGAFAPHVNAGITVSPRDVLTRVGFPLAHASVSVEEFNYSGGADVIAGPRVTIVADLLGRTRRHASLLEDFTDPDGPFTVFTFTNDDVPITQVLASLGMKLNVHRTLLVTVSALTPAYTRHALASHLAIVGGVDYAF